MAALILIDVQMGFQDPSWGKRNNPEAEANILKILHHWRATGQPVIHIRHDSASPDSALHPSQEGNALQPKTAPIAGEKLFSKSVNSAFIGTDLESYLHDQKISDLVIVGLTTDHCVSTTTRMAGNLGFQVKLVADATATFDRSDRSGANYDAETIHRIHLASLDGEFCTVVTTGQVIH